LQPRRKTQSHAEGKRIAKAATFSALGFGVFASFNFIGASAAGKVIGAGFQLLGAGGSLANSAANC
jgi:hypothetical protein